MKSLDEILSERAQSEYQTSLAAVLDPTSWTTANRDAKMVEIRTIAENVCTISEDFVKELVETKLDDRSILWHKIREQFITGELELLMGFRNELDSLPEEPENVPIDYKWLNEQIKIRYQEIANLNIEIAKLTSNEANVEEL